MVTAIVISLSFMLISKKWIAVINNGLTWYSGTRLQRYGILFTTFDLGR